MQTVQLIKSRIGQTGAERLGEFLKMPGNRVTEALGEAMNAMMGGLVSITQSEGSAARILKVINDGGHSGDLVEDLNSLFSNKDKLQLLITIGQNINNHFFHSKSAQMVDAIAHVNETDRNTANSLFSLAAPLVLGALGKAVRSENLSASDFTNKILSESEHSYKPELTTPVIPVSAPVYTPAEPTFQQTAAVPEPAVYKEKKRKKEANYNWLAWLLLAALGFAALFFGLKDRLLKPAEGDVSQIAQSTDSSEYVAPGDVFDNFNSSGNQDNTTSIEESSSETKVEKEPTRPAILPSETKAQSKPDIAENRKKESGAGAQKYVASPASEKKSSSGKSTQSRDLPANAEVLPSGAVFYGPEEEKYTIETTRDSKSMASKMDSKGTYFGINGLGFKSNSAEIVNKGEISSLVNFMKENPAAKIEIAGSGAGRVADDRAYALRDQLFQSGVPVGRMKVISGGARSDSPVMIKIN